MYLIIGANGFVGSYVLKNILERTDDNILAVDIHIEQNLNTDRIKWLTCDITSHNDLMKLNEECSNYDPLKVIYLAAYHLPDLVLAYPHIAWNINITALSDFVNTIDNVKCLFYSSTEMVYGEGSINKLFKETDPKNPVNAYGKNKSVAEEIVLGYGYHVVRFPFLIGPSIIGNKKSFYDIIVDTICNGNEINMFDDALKTALDFDTATLILVKLIEDYDLKKPRILNIAGDDILSKYEIGLKIAHRYNCNDNLIIPISVKNDSKIFIEKRADCTLLDNSLLKDVLSMDSVKINL